MRRFRGLFIVLVVMGLVLCGCNDSKSRKVINNKNLSIKGCSLNSTNTLMGMDEELIPAGSLLIHTSFYNETELLVMTQNEEGVLVIRLYNLFTGRMKRGCMVQNAEDPITWDCFIGNDKKIILQTQDSKLFYILDKDFKIKYSFKDLPKEYESVVVSKDGESAYFVKKKDDTLYRIELKTKEVTPIIKLKKACGMDIKPGEISDDNTFLTLHYENEQGRYGQILVSLEDREAAYYEDEYDSIHITGKTLQYCSEQMKQSGTVTTCKLREQQLKTDLTFESGEEVNCYQFSKDGNQVITIQSVVNKPVIFSYYDINHGYVIKRTTLDQKKYISYMSHQTQVDVEIKKAGLSFLSGNGISFNKAAKLACINYWDDGSKHCMIWNIEKEQQGEKEEKIQLFSKNQLQYENERMMEQIENKYHFKVISHDDAVRYFKEFAVVSLEDEEQIHSALLHVQKVLKKLPKELFLNFSYGSVKGMELYLCKKIITPFSYQVSNASGFADVIDGKQVIVLACNNLSEIETCFAHEFMHGLERVMDYKIVHKKLGNGVLEYWKSLSPRNSYCYGYVTKKGADIDTSNMGKYTPYDLEEKNSFKNVYFVDPYSRTYPAEDRARVFETLVTSEDNLPVYFKSEHLRKKAKYLAELIRKAFPELKRSKYYWEKWDLD